MSLTTTKQLNILEAEIKGRYSMFGLSEEKLTPEQELIVRRNVVPQYFDVEAMIKYLNEHETIDFDIFTKCCIKKVSYSFLVCFKSISRDLFIKRLEIYFYDLKTPKSGSEMTAFFAGYVEYSGLISRGESGFPFEEEPAFKKEYDLEPAYQLLDKVINEYKIPLKNMFDYIEGVFGTEPGFKRFLQWSNYVELLDELNEQNVFPENFYYSFNKEMEAHGQTPRLVLAGYDRYQGLSFDKETKSQYVDINGYFPVDPEGNVVLEWIGVWLENTDGVELLDDQVIYEEDDFFLMSNMEGDGLRRLRIKVNPNSRVFILTRQKGADGMFHNTWKQIFAGSCVSKFSFKPIVEARERLKLSQKEVADLADINLRSYQRMEAGESTPDGLALISLMSLLDIKFPEVFRKHPSFVDDDYSKFRSGSVPSEFLDEKDK